MTVAAAKQRAPKAATTAKAAAPPRHVASPSAPALVQRCACQHGMADDRRLFGAPIRRKCASCATDEELQRRVFQRCVDCDGAGGAPPAAHPGVANVVPSGHGAPLDPPTRAYFEPRFGRDLSGVRVHTGANADASASSIDALAYTVGEHVVVRSGYFAPQSDSGGRLLAHELTHTVQQRTDSGERTSVATQPYTISQPGDAAEHEADHVAAIVSAGGVAPPIGVAPRAVARQTASPPTAASGVTVATPGPGSAPVDQDAVSAAVDVIVDRVEGYTTWWDSTAILNQFRDKDAATTRAILVEVNSRLAGGVDKMLDDLGEEDRNTLRIWLIERHVHDYVLRLVSLAIKDLLEGYTSEDDAHEILALFGYNQKVRFEGDALDQLLADLQTVLGENEEGTRAWLFGDLDRVSAWRLEEFLFDAGGTRARWWAAEASAAHIYDLIEGYTSHADSTSIVNRFNHVPEKSRDYVLYRLDVITRRERDQSAEDSLMEDMDESDYERLRKMKGLELSLRPYDYSPPWYEAAWYKVVSIVDWALVVVQWIACGLAGVVTGLLSVLWDIVKIVIDLVIGARDLLGAVVYGLSGGAACSAEWLKVKQFFQGIAEFARRPLVSISGMWNRMWKDIEDEFITIEGPFTQCRVAELFMRKVINIIATIVLTLFTGYAVVKAGMEGITALRNFAALVREVGFMKAVAQVGAEVKLTVEAGVALRAGKLSELIEILRAPRQLITRIGTRLRGVLMMAQDEGYFRFVRSRAATAGRRFLGEEGRSWRDLSERWKARAPTLDERRAALAERMRMLEAELAARRARRGDEAPVSPEDQDIQTQIEETTDEANQLDHDTAALENEVSGQPPEGVGEPGGQQRRPGEPTGQPSAAERRAGEPAGEPAERPPEAEAVTPFVVQESPGVLEGMDEARAARRNLPPAPPGKTVAATIDYDQTVSGWIERGEAFPREVTDRVLARGREVGHTFTPDFRDHGVEGLYHASHAEKQLSVFAPNRPIAVNTPMCPDCIRYFQRLAVTTARPQIVADPNLVRAFLPNGTTVYEPVTLEPVLH